MQEVTTFKEGSLKVEFDGKQLTVYLNDYNNKSFNNLNDAIRDLGTLLGMATKAVTVGKQRMVDASKESESPIDLNDIPF